MKQTKLDSESIKWIKENPKEFIDELIRKSELVNNFSDSKCLNSQKSKEIQLLKRKLIITSLY